MKALLVAVNAKYIHTSLSVRTLKAYAMTSYTGAVKNLFA